MPKGRTVFIDRNLKPYPNQWDFLASIEVVTEQQLDEIIEANELQVSEDAPKPTAEIPARAIHKATASYGLPICAQRMLSEGVQSYQRVACFRLAVQLRKAGLPYDLTVAALKVWAPRNKPTDGKQIITEKEIVDQTAWAYARPYQGCGCEEAVVAQYCSPACPLKKRKTQGSEIQEANSSKCA